METEKAKIRRLYRMIRQQLKELSEVENVKDISEVEYIYNKCGWIASDCKILLDIKIPSDCNSVEEWRNKLNDAKGEKSE